MSRIYPFLVMCLTSCIGTRNGSELATLPTCTPATVPMNQVSTPTATGGDGNQRAPDPNASLGDGEYVIGPTYQNADEMAMNPSVPHGTVNHFTMNSSDSKIYTGLDPTLNTRASFVRDLWLYIPAQYQPGSAAPFMVVQDGGGYLSMATALDNLIAANQVPVMLALFINPGPGDGMGSERGLEYDTVSDAYVRFIETEVLPYTASTFNVKFTADPNGRATMGGSSGGAAAFTMAWFRPDLYRRVLTYSGTFVNQHPDNNYPHGAWEYHEHLIMETPPKPLRVFLEVGQNDINNEVTYPDGYHTWLSANQRMAVALHSQHAHYRFLYARNAGHVDAGVYGQTLPDTLRWLWRGYPNLP